MPVDPARAKSLFLSASELADLAKRAAYLDRECGDAELRERVEALLRANDSAPLPPVVAATMDSVPGQPQTEDREDRAAQVGVVIAGKYTLAEVIGEGGMGSVWRAKQTEPVKRFVAVKLIKEGMDSRQVLARFEAERQALALMDHPNIAKVLDGGLHDRRPYFVMELVKGVPITDYCDAQKLTPQQRLELFVQACQAIQHAHQKGIIHRDIKPSNVLVALYDDKPVVKVIDFGVAKATGGTLTEHTLDTGFGGVVGTPEYMSPEQATLNNLDIDTRSDVYALGVLLYELLTGSPPFSGAELKKKGLMEILRVVREEDPPRPSTKLSTADALPSLSANRSTEPRKLTGLLRNELDWVVMKALEKDRTRRYETANGFAADVQRYLAGEPVIAHPPSTAYRLKKFVRRNRGQVVAASLILLTLVGGIAGTTWGLFEARNQKQKADEEKQIAEAVKDFLQTKLLAQADTTAQANQLLQSGGFAAEAKLNPTIRELLDRAAKELAPDKIEANFPKQPLVHAELLRTVGLAYYAVGEASTAINFLSRSVELFRQHLGPDHPDTLQSMNDLAVGYQAAGEPDKALPLFEETLKLRKAKLGLDHPDTLESMGNLANFGYRLSGQLDKALPLLEETLRIRSARFGPDDPDDPDTLICMGNLSLGYQAAGQLDKALPLHEETFKLMKAKLGPDHPYTLISMHNLAGCYGDVGKFDLALPLFEEALKLMKAKLGPDHPYTLASMNQMAGGYEAVGQPDKALSLFEETLKLTKAKLGPDHPDTLVGMNNLAFGYTSAGQWEKALPLLEEALPLYKAKLGPDHPDTLTIMSSLAAGYHRAQKFVLALALNEETLKLRKAKLGPDHPDTIDSMINVARMYKAAGNWDKAFPLAEEAFKLSTDKLAPDHPHTLKSMGDIALGYQDAGKLDLALPLFEEAFKRSTDKLGPDHPDTLISMRHLAGGYRAAGNSDKALPLWEEAFRLSKARLGPDHPDTLTNMGNLAVGYEDAGKRDLALTLNEESFKLIKARFGPDHRETIVSMGNLAAAYKATGQLSKALPLFEEAFKLSTNKFGPEHPDTLNLMGSLAICHQDAGRHEKALPLLEEAFKLTRAKLGPDHLNTLKSMGSLGVCYWSMKQFDNSVPLFEELLTLHEKKLGRTHPATLQTVANLGVNYKDAGRVAEAIPLLEEVYQASKELPPLRWVGTPLLEACSKAGKSSEMARLIDEFVADARKALPKDSPQLAGVLAQFGLALLEAKGFTDAELLLRECLAIREKTQPDVWTTFNTHSMLGRALLGQQKYADAEPLLLKGYEGMKAREETIPPQGATRLTEAIEQLVQLYAAWHTAEPDKSYDAKAAEWQQKLDEHNTALAAEKPATTSDK